MFIKNVSVRILCLVWLLLFLMYTQAFAQQPVPVLSAHVLDTTATLSVDGVATLDAKLAAFEQSTGSQLVVLVVASTQPEDITSFANRVANTWKIGRKDVGDGLLLVVALNDRKLRIEVAKTLEGAVPDLAAKRIIEQTITPLFKQGNYLGGLDAGVDQLMGLVRGEALPAPAAAAVKRPAEGFDWMNLGVFMFIAIPVVGNVTRSILGKRLGALATGGVAGVIAMLVTSSLLLAAVASVMGGLFTLLARTAVGRSHIGGAGAGGSWGSGSHGSGGFGGGFGSGGGGDFGGGGASGDW
jgi:uncharacterized protein